MNDALWRVYAWEWVVAHSTSALEVDGQNECKKVFREKYEGRVREKDWRIKRMRTIRPSPLKLELRLPNLQGEYKYKAEAMDLYVSLPHAHLVEQGSPEERELLSYGKKMLPA